MKAFCFLPQLRRSRPLVSDGSYLLRETLRVRVCLLLHGGGALRIGAVCYSFFFSVRSVSATICSAVR